MNEVPNREIPNNAPSNQAPGGRLATGRVAIVTGGSRGIGAAVAVRLAEDGADVVITYHEDRASADKVVEQIKGAGGRALAVQADSGERGAVEAVVDRTVGEFGRLDVLVNNAGAFVVAPLTELSIDDFDRAMAVNVRSAFAGVKAATAHMGAGSAIINIGSNAAEHVAFPGFSAYSASKAALIGMSKALARELGPQGITVNVVSPGPTDTDTNPADSEGADTVRSLTAVARYAQPWEIAAAVSYLAGPGGRYVTGSVVNVDGGFNS